MTQQTLIELLYGKGAHANPVAVVLGIPARIASRKLEDYPHSICEVVAHMNYWMDYELRRIRGKPLPYPAHAAASWPSVSLELTEPEWERCAAQFVASIEELSVLAESDPQILNREVEDTHKVHDEQSSSLLAILWQIAVHNSYHLGQIVLLRRLLSAWPAEAGDTW